MDWRDLQSSLGAARERRERASALGDSLTSAFEGLLAGVRPGSEDPVLAALLGDEVASLVRRLRWSSLVLNPGSTSTKMAVYTGTALVAAEELRLARGAPDGLDARVDQVVRWLGSKGLGLAEVSGIAARGGLMAPVRGGTYGISRSMVDDLERSPYRHPANLAVPMALRLGEIAGTDPELTVTDPVTIDELEPAQRLTGSARVRNDEAFAHFLNQRAAAALTGRLLGVPVADVHLVTCHMGGGMSAIRHEGGRMVQVVPAFGGMPSANRSGGLPLHRVIRLIEERRYSLADLERDVLASSGGLVALAGTDDFEAVMDLLEGGARGERAEKVRLVVEFFAGSVAAHIQALAAAPRPVDAVVLTGGLARDARFCEMVRGRIHLDAIVARLPGSVEQAALAAGLLMACAHPETRLDYDRCRDDLAREREADERALEVEVFETPARGGKAPSAPSRLEDIVAAARGADPPVIALVGAANVEALLAVKQAVEIGDPPMARFLLLGPYEEIAQIAWEIDLPVDGDRVAPVDAVDPVAIAAELLAAGVADTLMKGSETTSAVLKGYLAHAKERGLAGPGHRLSHLALFEIAGRKRLFGITDAAMNTYPDVAARVEILENAVAAMRSLGYLRPKVAVISAAETPSDSVTSSMEARAIAERFEGRDDLIIEGPLSVDIALSEDSAREKRYAGAIRGDADLLLVPDIDAGNAVYKSFTIVSGATVGGAIVGGEVPLILTSRGDSSRTKLASIALAVTLIRRSRGEALT